VTAITSGGQAIPQRHRTNKNPICRYNMLDFLVKASPLRARERGPQPSVWKVNSRKFLRACANRGRVRV
jgi:hypothetical protein